MLDFLLAMETGAHVKSQARETAAVRAFRLEVSSGIVDIDGEAIECEDVQVEVHPGVLTVMT